MTARSTSARPERRLSWHGAVDIDHAPAARRELLQALARGESVLIDLGAVERLDTAGLAVLVEGLQQAQAANLRLQLTQVGEGVARMLTLTRLDSLFEIGS